MRKAPVNAVECLIENVRNSGTGGGSECIEEVLPRGFLIMWKRGKR